MSITITVKNEFSIQEASEIICSALAFDERITKHKKDKYANICSGFENKYGMNSDIFMEKFETGKLDDRDDFFDWHSAKKGLENLSKKLQILSGISI